MVCQKHNGEIVVKWSEFSNFTWNVYICSNIDENYRDLIQFYSHLVENENIRDSKLFYVYANLAVL